MSKSEGSASRTVKRSFNSFLRKQTDAFATSLKIGLPKIEGWRELKSYLYRKGTSDEELVEARQVWRRFETEKQK